VPVAIAIVIAFIEILSHHRNTSTTTISSTTISTSSTNSTISSNSTSNHHNNTIMVRRIGSDSSSSRGHFREPVGEFYVRLVRGPSRADIDKELTSSSTLFKTKGMPTVMSFYNNG